MVIAEREPETKQMKEVAPATILLCAWRNLVVETAECLIMLRDQGWGYVIKRGDALISRSRSQVVSDWYRHTDEDVFLMIDDDVVFESSGAAAVVQLAREKRSVACAAYPVKDGGHLACRRYVGQEIRFGEGSPPVEIVYPATGFMAVHRDVITKMITAKTPDGEPVFPLCDAVGQAPMWPFFDCFAMKNDDGRYEYLSEDYAFGEQALRLGFQTWLDPSVILYHMGTHPYTIENMKHVMNICQACEENVDSQGKGHRLDCPTLIKDVTLRTSRGLEMVCDATDGVITKAIENSGNWEEPVARAIELHLKPGWTFLDLGAHVGYFSTIAAKAGAYVIAVEANPRYAGMLKENLAKNGLGAEIHRVAVSDKAGEAFLQVDQRFFAHPSAAYLDTHHGMPVNAVRLADVLNGRYPEFVKADIEGMEWAVFNDAPEVLDNAKVVLFEVGPSMASRYGYKPQQLVDLMCAHGFTVTHPEGQELAPDFIAGMRIDQYANLLAVKE